MNWARALLAALVVLNVGYFAWTRGALALFGSVPAALAEREPQRMDQQIRPGALKIRNGPAAEPPAAEPPAVPAAAAEPAAPAAPPTPTPVPKSAAESEGL